MDRRAPHHPPQTLAVRAGPRRPRRTPPSAQDPAVRAGPRRPRGTGLVALAVALAFLSVIPSGNLLLLLPLPLPLPLPFFLSFPLGICFFSRFCPCCCSYELAGGFSPLKQPRPNLGFSPGPPAHASHAKPLAVRAGPVKPPNPSKIAKPPINTGDLYFQNLA